VRSWGRNGLFCIIPFAARVIGNEPIRNTAEGIEDVGRLFTKKARTRRLDVHLDRTQLGATYWRLTSRMVKNAACGRGAATELAAAGAESFAKAARFAGEGECKLRLVHRSDSDRRWSTSADLTALEQPLRAYAERRQKTRDEPFIGFVCSDYDVVISQHHVVIRIYGCSWRERRRRTEFCRRRDGGEGRRDRGERRGHRRLRRRNREN
jgi:hypothetical protein